MSNLLELLAGELERPRPVTPQVVNHLIATYGVDRSRVSEFLSERLAALEDFEFELVLAPLFTPTLREQASVAELLGPVAVEPQSWSELVRQLADRPTVAHLLTPEGRTLRVPLRSVVLERFVHRLQLDGTIPRPLVDRIESRVPEAHRPLLKAIARRAVWRQARRADILATWLEAAVATEPFPISDGVALLQLVETYEPEDLAALRALIPHWQEVLRQEIRDATAPRPFLNGRIQDLHGGARDQRRPDEARAAAKHAELAMLERLYSLLSQRASEPTGVSNGNRTGRPVS
ncbi:MAG: hypothetical protein RMK20_07755 [Verrucomicrobiales bacterium]|nr:hypothetical protein [Verrucomicrobiales bacterium]